MKKLLSIVLATCTFVFAADLNIVKNELPENKYIILEKNKISQEFRELSISVEKIINRSEKIKNLDLGEVTKIENKK